MEEAEHVVQAGDGQRRTRPGSLRPTTLVSIPVTDEADRLVRRPDLRRHRRPARGRGRRRHQAARCGVRSEEEISDDVWTITKSRFNLALRQSADRHPRIGRHRPLRERAEDDGGARRADADRRVDGRQRRHAIDDRRGAALATKEIDRANAMRVVRRELVVGLLNGLAFAVIMAVVAVAWYGPAQIGPGYRARDHRDACPPRRLAAC